LRRSWLRAGAATTIAAALATNVWAVRPILWTEAASGPRLGEADAVAFTALGAIVLAPRVEDIAPRPVSEGKEPVETATSDAISDPLVWCETLDSKGNVYLGTGHSGRILRVTARGEVSVLGSLPEPEVTALLAARSGELYAGTSPNGAVYKVGKDGTPAVLYEPEERYIWALAEDSSGNIYAGSGEKGKIFRITPKGEGKVFYDSTEPHITALLAERGGALLAGSDGTGKIYRISPEGAAVVVYDSSYRQISDIAEDGAGQIYASAVAAGAGEIPAPAPRLLVRPPESEASIAPRDDVSPVKPEAPALARDRDREPFEAEFEGGAMPQAAARVAREGGGAVFRISPNGRVDELWRSSTDVPYALAATSEGTVYAGTGEPARLLRLEDKGRAVVLSKFPQAQLTDLALDGNGSIVAATSNSGGAYRITRELADQGAYSSPVRDAFARAAWGRIRWDAQATSGQKVEIRTRSGNSSVPDDTWSPWSAAYSDAEGSEIASPPARFIQWRGSLARGGSTGSPTLRSVTVTYLPQNRAPKVRELRLLTLDEAPPPDAGEDPPLPSCQGPLVKSGAAEETAKGTAGPASRMRTLIWHAEDPDDDKLVFRLYAQREGSEAWLPVGSDLVESTCAFDQSKLGEGRYRLKAVASDAPSNYGADALESEMVADGVVLDLTPPVLTRLPSQGRGGAIEVQAVDALSPIASAEIQRADRTVAVARPADGVLDSKSERFLIELPPGTQTEGLRLRVKDVAGNESILELGPPSK
jgi:hypothetical protein